MTKTITKRAIATMAVLLSLALLIPAYAFAGEIYTAEKAKSLAKKKVGGNARVVQVDSDNDKGGLMYEVDLVKGNKKYSLTYKAKTGKLVEYEWEIRNKSGQQIYGNDKSKSSIKALALKQVAGAKVKSIKKEKDDGLTEYKVTMAKGKKAYTLVYNAKNGTMLEYKWKITNVSTSSKYIGVNKAKTIALGKVPGAQVVKAEFDNDDGTPVYEVELVTGSYEYEIVVHAKTGKILEVDKEYRWS